MTEALQKFKVGDWKIKTSDQVSDVMRWGKNAHWCTKREHYANQYLGGGKLFALTKTGSRRPSHQLYISDRNRIEFKDRLDTPVNLDHFFDQNSELKEFFESRCDNFNAALDKQALTWRDFDAAMPPREVDHVLSQGMVYRHTSRAQYEDIQTVCEPPQRIVRGFEHQVDILFSRTDDVPQFIPGDVYEIPIDGHRIVGQLMHHSRVTDRNGTKIELTLQG